MRTRMYTCALDVCACLCVHMCMCLLDRSHPLVEKANTANPTQGMYVYMCVCLCVCIHVCIRLYWMLCVSVCTNVYVCTGSISPSCREGKYCEPHPRYVSRSVYMYTCIHVYMCLYTYICIHTYTSIFCGLHVW